jgi:hypothetical protein
MYTIHLYLQVLQQNPNANSRPRVRREGGKDNNEVIWKKIGPNNNSILLRSLTIEFGLFSSYCNNGKLMYSFRVSLFLEKVEVALNGKRSVSLLL